MRRLRRSALIGALAAGALAAPALAAPDGVVLRNTVVHNTDPLLAQYDAIADPETSIAINPENPREIVISAARSAWGPDGHPAPLFWSTDGGQTWTEGLGVPPPPSVTGTHNCPCNQTVAFGRGGNIYATFLVDDFSASHANVVTGTTKDPTNPAAWQWSTGPSPLTNQVQGAADQPQVAVGPDPQQPGMDRVYVAYDDLAAPDARVAVSDPINPAGPVQLRFSTDSFAGSQSPGAANPGLRIAVDQRTGHAYILYQRSTGAGQPKQVTYMLNRSTDGGRTWGLNGQPDGIPINTTPVPSPQGLGYKLGGVNALLGGVDALAVDPRTGDVLVVYGADAAGSGGNQLFLRRVTTDQSGRMTVGAPSQVTTAPSTALPAVAATAGGTVGVLYTSYEGLEPGTGLPVFTARLAKSVDGGLTFSDQVLDRFVSPAGDNGDPRQRVLGDYQQMHAAGDTLMGVFPGNGANFGRPIANIDPIFFSTVASDLALAVSGAPGQVAPGTPISYTLTVTNRGPGTATNVKVAHPLPGGVAVPAATPSQGSCTVTGAGVSCSLGTLAVGASATVSITAVPTVSGAVTVSAVAYADEIDPTPEDAHASAATTVGSGALSVTTGALPTAVQPGRPVAYVFSVTNNGDGPATGVRLHDDLPPGVTLVDATASQGQCAPVGNGVRCDLGDLPRGGAATVTITVIASRPGTIANSVRVTTDSPGGLGAAVSGPPTNLAVSIARAGSRKRALAGGVVAYRVMVSNTGPSQAAGVRVQSPLPRGARLVAVKPTQGSCERQGAVVSCALGALARGARAAVLVQFRPRRDGRLTVRGRVESAVRDAQPADDEARLGLRIQPASDLAISMARSAPAAPGFTGTYRLRVRAHGPSRATGVTVVGRLPAGSRLRSVSSSRGRCTVRGRTISCRLGTLAPGRGATIVARLALANRRQRALALVRARQRDPWPRNDRVVLRPRTR